METQFDFGNINKNNLCPDACVLMEIIERFVPVFQQNINLYCDIKKQMVDKFLNKPTLSIGESLCFEYFRKKEEKPIPKNPDLKLQLVKIAKQLKQLNRQTVETKKQRELTVEQLNKEISDLQERISSYEGIISNLKEHHNSSLSSRKSCSKIEHENSASFSQINSLSNMFTIETPQKALSNPRPLLRKTNDKFKNPKITSFESLK